MTDINSSIRPILNSDKKRFWPKCFVGWRTNKAERAFQKECQMSKSIAEQVQAFLQKSPDASNKELYAAFPDVRGNTLRHYRSKFAAAPAKKRAPKKIVAPKTPKVAKEEVATKVPKAKKEPKVKKEPKANKATRVPKAPKAAKAPKVAKVAVAPSEAIGVPKSKRGRPKKVADDTEMRLATLERKVDQLLKTLDVEVGKRGRRVNPIDKRIKEMESTILKFLKERGSSMPADLAKLDDLQKALTSKIAGFISNLKNR